MNKCIQLLLNCTPNVKHPKRNKNKLKDMFLHAYKNHCWPIFVKSIKKEYYKALIYSQETTEEEMEQTFTRTREERLHEN